MNGDATVLDVVFDGDPDTWLDASLCDGTADRWRIAQLTAGSFLTAVSARLSARADDRDDVPDPS